MHYLSRLWRTSERYFRGSFWRNRRLVSLPFEEWQLMGRSVSVWHGLDIGCMQSELIVVAITRLVDLCSPETWFRDMLARICCSCPGLWTLYLFLS